MTALVQAFECPTAVYVGNLRRRARVSELKADLYKLFYKCLNVQISKNDVSLFTGVKRYAIINVHNLQNVDFVLENLYQFKDLNKIDFDFDTIVESGMSLYVDTVKSQDEKQVRDDFESSETHRPYLKPHTSRTATELRMVRSSMGIVSIVSSDIGKASVLKKQLKPNRSIIQKTPPLDKTVNPMASPGRFSRYSHGSLGTQRLSYRSLNTTRSSSDSINTTRSSYTASNTATHSHTVRNTPRHSVNFSRHSYPYSRSGKFSRSSVGSIRRPRRHIQMPCHSTDLDVTAEETENFADDESGEVGDKVNHSAHVSSNISDIVAIDDSLDSGAEMENSRPDSETPVLRRDSLDSFIDLRQPPHKQPSSVPRSTKRKTETSVHWSDSQSSFTEMDRLQVKGKAEMPKLVKHQSESEKHVPENTLLRSSSPRIDLHTSDTGSQSHMLRSANQGSEPRMEERALQHTLMNSLQNRNDFFSFLVTGEETPSPVRKMQGPVCTEEEESATPYYKSGEIVADGSMSKCFKDYDGQYTLREMREHMTRCVCGLLNSGQKGTLLIGVRGDGLVIGIECDEKQEERIRRHFDSAIGEIFPRIYIEDYSIHFVPVVDINGQQLVGDLKVIEVFVDSMPILESLYECKDGVFVWRNGTLIGPILPSHIQEWKRQKHLLQLGEMRRSEINLQEELNKNEFMIRRQADTIISQKSEIEARKALELQRSQKPKAKTCNIL